MKRLGLAIVASFCVGFAAVYVAVCSLFDENDD